MPLDRIKVLLCNSNFSFSSPLRFAKFFEFEKLIAGVLFPPSISLNFLFFFGRMNFLGAVVFAQHPPLRRFLLGSSSSESMFMPPPPMQDEELSDNFQRGDGVLPHTHSDSEIWKSRETQPTTQIRRAPAPAPVASEVRDHEAKKDFARLKKEEQEAKRRAAMAVVRERPALPLKTKPATVAAIPNYARFTTHRALVIIPPKTAEKWGPILRIKRKHMNHLVLRTRTSRCLIALLTATFPLM